MTIPTFEPIPYDPDFVDVDTPADWPEYETAEADHDQQAADWAGQDER